MSDATKAKLIAKGLPGGVVEKLHAAGLALPKQIKKLKDFDLRKFLSAGELTELRKKIKELKK